jgi:nitrile hydratase beta subunit
MDGAHDLGGRSGFGSVDLVANEPVFHEAWEATAWALNILAIGTLRFYMADTYRHAVERMRPDWYLAARYYERMLTGATTLMVERGVISQAELEDRAGGAFPLANPVAALPEIQTKDTVEARPRFEAGDTVTVTAKSTPGHTRCPAYVRGRRGVVRWVYPLAYYPELRAHSTVKRREHTYAIEFRASDLWPEADRQQTMVVELFGSYLEPARDAL